MLALGLAACLASAQPIRVVPLQTGGCGDFGDATRDHGFLKAQIVAPQGILLRSSCFPLASLVPLRAHTQRDGAGSAQAADTPFLCIAL